MVFRTKFQLSFRLSDPANIMFFGNILDITHDSFEQFIQAAGFKWKEWFNPDREWACPIRHVDIDFKAPFLPGEFYDIDISISRLGNSSFTVKHYFSKDGIHNATVLVTHAFANRSNFTKANMPDEVRSKLSPYAEV